jgi:hypothetical protein
LAAIARDQWQPLMIEQASDDFRKDILRAALPTRVVSLRLSNCALRRTMSLSIHVLPARPLLTDAMSQRATAGNDGEVSAGGASGGEEHRQAGDLAGRELSGIRTDSCVAERHGKLRPIRNSGFVR